jgi:predicted enzyme related to lactoylglutathione lyase
MTPILEIAFTCYPVIDMARARNFYENVLGLKPTMIHAAEDGNSAWTEYEIASGAFALGQHAGWNPSSDGAAAAFEMEDFDAAIAELKEKGVTFKMEPFPTPVCQMAFILDTEGNTLCIHKRHAH